jgi:WD40 repeat protein
MEIATGKILRSYSLDISVAGQEQPTILGAIFSPDGSKIAGLTAWGPVLWDSQNTAVIWTTETVNGAWNATTEASAEPDSGIVFSPDGSVLVTMASTVSSDTWIWSTASGRLIKVLKRGDQLDAQFSRDGKILYTANQLSSDEAILIWSTETWQQVGSVRIEAGAS